MRMKTMLGGLVLALWTALAGAASLVVLPQQLVVDVNGAPRSGAKLHTYECNGTTPLTTYTTSAIGPQHANPVESVSTGLFPAIYLSPTVTCIKLALTDSADVPIYTEDDIPVTDDPLYGQTADELAAGVTPTDTDYPVGYTQRYGAVCDGATNDTDEIQAALDVAGESHGRAHVQTGTCLVDTLTFDAGNFILEGEGRGSILKASTNIPTTSLGGAVLVSLAGSSDTTVNQALLDAIYGASVVDVRSNEPLSLENVTIRDLTFEGRNNAISGIWGTGVTRGSSFENLYFNGFESCALKLNGSWSFGIDHVFIEGDGTGGTGGCFGISGNGERDAKVAVNGVTGDSIEITQVTTGITWNVGAGNTLGTLIIEGLDGDGVAGQSLDATSFPGFYCEDVAGECFDLGGTNGTDTADGLVIAGGLCNQDVGECVRLDGVQNSQIGPFKSSGSNTHVYVMTAAEGADTIGNFIWVPAVSGTYIQNFDQLDLTDNTVHTNAVGGERLDVPRLFVQGNVGFYGTTPVAQQAAIAALTDNSGGTPSDTIPAQTGSYVEATQETTIASLAAKINALRATLRAYGLLP